MFGAFVINVEISTNRLTQYLSEDRDSSYYQGVPTAEKHPWRHCRAVGGEFPAASGRGLYSAPRQSERQGTEGHPRSSGSGNRFLTSRLLDL
jgi:hypothetical protein